MRSFRRANVSNAASVALRSVLLVTLALAPACGDDDGSTTTDSGPRTDLGLPGVDSGPPPPPPTDGGPGPTDSGPSPVDSGPPVIDAGPPPADTGPTIDAGPDNACTMASDCAWGEIDHEITQRSDCICLFGCPSIPQNRATVERRQAQYRMHCDPRVDGMGDPCPVDDCIAPPPLSCTAGACAP